MKATSDSKPETFVKTHGIIHHNFNIQQKETTDEMNGSTRTYYEYDYVRIKPPITSEKIIRARIAEHYNVEDEIALINDKIAGQKLSEYNEYQSIRNKIKKETKMILSTETKAKTAEAIK